MLLEAFFTITSILIIFLTPGPVVVIAAFSGIQHGFKKTIPFIKGAFIAATIHILIAGIGYQSIFKQYPHIFPILKITGCLFFIYLAFQLLKNNSSKTTRCPILLLAPDGFLIGIFNPKLPILLVLLYTKFVSLNASFAEWGLVTLIFISAYLFSLLVWTLSGCYLNQWMSKYTQFVNSIFAFMMVCLSIWIIQ